MVAFNWLNIFLLHSHLCSYIQNELEGVDLCWPSIPTEWRSNVVLLVEIHKQLTKVIDKLH